MASPFNPFGGGRGQRGGTTTGTGSTAGRGGAPTGRGSQFQSRGSSASRATKHRGRGRGSISQSFRGRGTGAPARGGASHLGAPAVEKSNAERTNSPFAQLGQKQSFSSIFGGQQMTRAKSPSLGRSNGSAAQTFKKHSPYSLGKGPAPQDLTNGPVGGAGQPVPIEDASTLAGYSERYEQVSNICPSVSPFRYYRRTIYLTHSAAQS